MVACLRENRWKFIGIVQVQNVYYFSNYFNARIGGNFNDSAKEKS